MPPLVAARHNPELRLKYENMIQAGKHANVALTARMRERIELANTLIQTDRNRPPKAT